MATTSIQRRTETHRLASTDFRTPDWFARKPMIGVWIMIIGLAIFGILAYNVYTQGPMIAWDKQMENRMHTSALASPAWVRALMVAGFYVGLHGYIGVVVLMGLYFLYKRFWKEFLMIAIGCGGQGALWIGLANVFHRDRPVLDNPIGGTIPYPSFPSGHTMSGVIGFGLLAYLLLPRIASRLWRGVVIFIALLLMVYIGFSRFFMGSHYLTDVAGGLAMGFAWTALVFTVIELLFKKGENKHEHV